MQALMTINAASLRQTRHLALHNDGLLMVSSMKHQYELLMVGINAASIEHQYGRL
jgi:hypothetical protein